MKEKTPNEHNNTMSHDNKGHSKSSEIINLEKGNLATTLDGKNLTLEDIRNSIKIDDEGAVIEVTKSVVDRIGLNKELYNATFINIGFSVGSFAGLSKAIAKLRNHPQEKIVMYGVLAEDARIYSNTLSLSSLITLKSCLENPNFVIVDAIKNFDFCDVKFGQGYNKKLYEGICKYIQSRKYEYIGTIRHKLRIRSDEVDVNESLENNKLALELYDDYNSIYGPCTFEEFVKVITDEEGYKEGVDIMEGKKLVGIYCDIDDTLIIRGKDGYVVNEKVLNYLKEQEKLGREIHIRTGGNIFEQQQKLNKFGIKYPLISKFRHRGSEAEIVIDDQDYNSFMYDYGIKAKNYINVYDL